MKKLSSLGKSLSICLTLIILTNSAGYALELPFSNEALNCGQWSIEGGSSAKDRRIKITPKPITESNCPGLFSLSNQTDINIGNISIGGGYTLQLDTTTNDAQTQFLLIDDPFIPFLFPGIDIEIKTIPNAADNKAVVNLQGDLSLSAFTFDLAFFTIKSLLALANIPCVIPTEQIFLASNRAAPILNNTAQLAFNGDLSGSYNEFSNAMDMFYEKRYDIFKDIIVDCKVDVLKPKNIAPAQAKILYAYLTWLPVVIFDYLQYDGAPASFTFVYTPPVATLPSEKWIAFLNQKDIWLIHPDGSDLTQVTKNDGDNPPIEIFKWSPDGGTLAYSQGSNIYLYDVQTLKTEILETGGAGGFDWSLNGRQILYDAAFSKDNPWTNNGLWVINLQNGNKRRVVSGSSMNPLWSSEGSHVIFAIPAFEPAGYGVADFSTGESISLPLNSSGSAGNCAWAPSELIIACITYTDEWPYKPEIRLLDVNGNIMQEILLPERMSGNFIIHWSPNGEKLAISYLAGGSADTLLDILLINKKNFSTLAIGFISDWSPDGEWILSWGGGKVPFPIYLTNTISGDSVQIAEGMFPVWQP